MNTSDQRDDSDAREAEQALAGLNARRRAFVEHFVRTAGASASASVTAAYGTVGQVARTQGYKLMQDAQVQLALLTLWRQYQRSGVLLSCKFLRDLVADEAAPRAMRFEASKLILAPVLAGQGVENVGAAA